MRQPRGVVVLYANSRRRTRLHTSRFSARLGTPRIKRGTNVMELPTPDPRSAADDPSRATVRDARRRCASDATPSSDRCGCRAAGTATATKARGRAPRRSRSGRSAPAPCGSARDHGVTLKSPATISGSSCAAAKDAMPASSALRSREFFGPERPVQVRAEHGHRRAVPIERDARGEHAGSFGQRERFGREDRPAREHDRAMRARLG